MGGFLSIAASSFGIEGLKIIVQCPDVVLSWPSTSNETYIVQHRATLDPSDTWTTLTNLMPPAEGTNWTAFVHADQVNCPSGQVFGLMSGGSGSGQTLTTATALSATDIEVEYEAAEVARLEDLLERCKREEREPYLWELENRPPYPWEDTGDCSKSLFNAATESLGGTGLMESGVDDVSEPNTGFYRVVRNGVHLVGITNGMTLSGTVSIPVELGHDVGTLASLSLNESGSPVGDAILNPPFERPVPTIILDTTSMSNGVHQITGGASWLLAGDDGDAGPAYYSADSHTIGINVQNEISFPDWMPRFGQDYDELLITARSAHTNADWYVDVYGDQDEYLGYFGDHTSDGSIGVIWDLTGPYGEYRDDEYFTFVVSTIYDIGESVVPMGASGSSSAARRSYRNYDRWTERGDWVVANQLAWENVLGADLFNLMTDAFVTQAELVDLTVRPNPSSGEAFRIHVGLPGDTDPTPNDNWTTFRTALFHPESRNVFYSGHGGNDGIGRNPANTNRFISQAEIAARLHTLPEGQTNRHAFRFVFLDGCETAKGHLPEAFGIVVRRENISVDYYLASGERTSAFVGWNSSPSVAFTAHAALLDHERFIVNFLARWTSEGRGVREALDLAPSGPFEHSDVDPDELTLFGYSALGYLMGNGN